MSWFKFFAKSWIERRPRRWSPLHLEPLEARCVPATITPKTFADGGLDSGSLRDAVLQFNSDSGTDDDTIQLLSGTYRLTIRNDNSRHETAGLTGDLNLTQTSHRWIIQGAGPSTIIDASQLQDRVFDIVTPGINVIFQDLVIQGGLAQDDGTDGPVAGTTDALGGGILNNGGDLTLDNVVLQNNAAQGGEAPRTTLPGYRANGGGLYSISGALILAGATIANNRATGGRGGDHNGTFRAGVGGAADGGGLYATAGSLDVSASMISSNQATGGRGGDGSFYRTSPLTTGNGGAGGLGQGGGLYVNGRSLTITASTIASNHGTAGAPGLYAVTNVYNGYGEGGGVDNLGTLTITGSTTVSANSADFGGGIANSGTLTVTGSSLSGNSAESAGGGIVNGDRHYSSGTITVSNSTLSSNTARFGGGIYNDEDADLTVSDSTLSGNSAAVGGAILNSCALTINNSILSGNSAGAGGAIDNLLAGPLPRWLTVSNSTLSGNSAGGDGGGIYTWGSSIYPVQLTNVTLTGNRANISGGSFHGGGFSVASNSLPILHNTLIAGNFNGATGPARDDVYGPLRVIGDHNLIGDGTGMTGLSNGVNGNLAGSAAAPIDPLLGPLAGNGGPTLTHALLPGSPAIDAGNNAYATDWDQRGPGYPRIVNGVIDIGAFEFQQDGGYAPHRSVRLHATSVPLDGAALLPLAISRSPALSPSPSSVNAQPQATLPGPQPAVVDRLFTSPNQEDTGFTLARMKRGMPIARDTQEQIAILEIIPPEPVLFETPFQGPLLADLDYIR